MAYKYALECINGKKTWLVADGKKVKPYFTRKVLRNLKLVGKKQWMRETHRPKSCPELGLQYNVKFAMNMGTIKGDVQEKTILQLFYQDDIIQ